MVCWLGTAGCLWAAGETSRAQPMVKFHAQESSPDLVEVRVTGLPGKLPAVGNKRSWAQILRVVAVDPDSGATAADLPPLLGRFAVEPGAAGLWTLSFQPRFPPAPGLRLEARFDGDAWADQAALRTGSIPNAEAHFQIPKLTRRPSTRVLELFPKHDTVPANLLRLYVQFSAPMSAHRVLPHVRLLDPDGQEVPVAFIGRHGGLWDSQQKRLTLLVHPGRVKRGVGPQQAMGAVLKPGHQYRLQISTDAMDAAGLPLAEPFEQVLNVGPADYDSPDPRSWTLLLPTAPHEPLRAQLRQPADHALLQRLPLVLDHQGRSVAGQASAGSDGLTWTFQPEQAWRPGRYTLRVPAHLEDPSGNRPGRRFEEPPGGPKEETVDVDFTLRL